MSYTAILDTGNALVEILREAMVPDVITTADKIGLCSPADRGEAVLSVHLYDVRESEEVRGVDMVGVNTRTLRFPSAYLTLFYMITVFSNAEVKFREGEEHRILGRVIQALGDHCVLSPETLKPMEKAVGRALRIRMLNLDNEEKARLWTVPNTAAKLSVYFSVSPVEVESKKTRTISRVTDINFQIEE